MGIFWEAFLLSWEFLLLASEAPVTSTYKWNLASSLELEIAFNSPELVSKIEECSQLLDAGLVESSAKKMEEIFTNAADIALEIRIRSPSSLSSIQYYW